MKLLIAVFILGSTIVLASTIVASRDVAAAPSPDGATDQEPLENYVALVEELSLRRRVNVLFPNPQSMFDGYHLGFVNVGTGNLTFRRRDMVTRAAATNIAFTRVYDSRIKDNPDFGPGWRLSLAEEVIMRDGALTYIDRAGARHRFALGADGAYRPSPPKPSHLRTTVTASSTRVRIETDDGVVRDFAMRSETSEEQYAIASLKASNGDELGFHYGADGLSSITVGGERAFSVERDDSGRIVSAGDNLGRTVTYSYTAEHRLKDVLDVAGNLWWHEYDENGLTSAIGPNEQPYLKVRYASGKVSETRAGRNYAYEYHPSRRTQVSEGTGAKHTFHHTESGATYRMESTSGVWWQLTLDPDHLPSRLTTDRDSHFFYYDFARRLVKVSESSNYGKRERTMEYDDGELVAMRSEDGLTTVSRLADKTVVTTPSSKIEFSTDSRGVRYVQSTFRADGSKRTVAVERDRAGEVTALRSETSAVRFARDGMGRIVKVRYPNGFESAYAYDALGNRASAHYSGGASERYAYDPSGNIVRISIAGPNGLAGAQSYDIGEMNRVRSIANVHNGLSMKIAYDADGRPVSFKTKDDAVAAKYEGGVLVSLRSATTGAVASVDEQMRYDMDVDVVHERAFAKRSLLARDIETRIQPDYGAVGFSTLNEAMVSDHVDLNVPSYTEAIMTLDLAGAFSGPGGHVVIFEKPSNPVFFPPEYASINCCVPCVGLNCVCAEDRSLSDPRRRRRSWAADASWTSSLRFAASLDPEARPKRNKRNQPACLAIRQLELSCTGATESMIVDIQTGEIGITTCPAITTTITSK